MMNMKIRPTPCPLPCCAWKGWAYRAVLPRVAPKRHGATTGLIAATSLRLCDMPRCARWMVRPSGAWKSYGKWSVGVPGSDAKSLASQARHEMDAPKELFAGAKRGRVVTRKSAKLRESPRRFTKVRTDQGRG